MLQNCCRTVDSCPGDVTGHVTCRCPGHVTGALVTFIAPLPTKPDWIYFRYNEDQKMCGFHWEYPSYCVITAIYIPILSGAVLVFTGLRIRATLRNRPSVQTRLRQTTATSSNGQRLTSGPSVARRCTTLGTRRTLKIITFTSVAYFVGWSPYAVITLAQCFVRSFKPPAAVEFTIMWLANTNSAVNVFIYSSTNEQFRRQCVLLASRLCCSRWSCGSSIELPAQNREVNASAGLTTINLSTINATPTSIPVKHGHSTPHLSIHCMIPVVSPVNICGQVNAGRSSEINVTSQPVPVVSPVVYL